MFFIGEERERFEEALSDDDFVSIPDHDDQGEEQKRVEEVMAHHFTSHDTIQEDFDQIVGLTQVKQSLHRSVILPMSMSSHDCNLTSKGILLYGPSGTGKTRLAMAMAKEAKCNVLELKPNFWSSDQASEMLETIFNVAANKSPCLIILDHCETLIDRQYQFQLLDLVRLGPSGVVVVGITTDPHDLAPILVKECLLDSFHIPLPSQLERQTLLRVFLNSSPSCYDNKVSIDCLENLAELPMAHSRRDLMKMVDQARLGAMNRTYLSSHFQEVRVGPELGWQRCTPEESNAMPRSAVPRNAKWFIVVDDLDLIEAATILCEQQVALIRYNPEEQWSMANGQTTQLSKYLKTLDVEYRKKEEKKTDTTSCSLNPFKLAFRLFKFIFRI